MSSGVSVDSECFAIYEAIKLKKQYKYAIFKMSPDDRKIIVAKTAGPDATYDSFLQELKDAEAEGDCRYAIYDFDYKVERHGAPEAKTNKLLFFIWCPEKAKIKRKMIYTSSKDAIKKKLVGLGAEIQGTDDQEVSYEDVLEKCRSNERH